MSVETLLFEEGGFAYHILTPGYRDAALVVLARAFCTEPVCDAIVEINPKMKTEFLDWIQFVDYWMDHCSSNGMSVMALGMFYNTPSRAGGITLSRAIDVRF